MSLATRYLVLQIGLVVVMTVVVALVMVQQTRSWVTSRAESVTRSATTVIAHDPFVREGLMSEDARAGLQAYAHRVENESDVDFVTIMTPDGTRLTHVRPEFVGREYSGDRTHALAGETYTVTEMGKLGPSVRTIAAVRDDDGTVVGLVSTGVLLNQIAEENRQQLPGLALVVAALLAGSCVVSYLLARYLDRATHGQAPEELVRTQALHDAVLSRAREGLALLDERDEVVLANHRARDLLGPMVLPGDTAASGRRWPWPRRREPRSTGTLPEPLDKIVASGGDVHDAWCTVGPRTVIVSCVRAPGAPELRVLIVQDHTELTRLSGELDTVRTMASGLRAQTHEHANRMHTVMSLLELQRYPQALEVAAADLTTSRNLDASVVRTVADPFLAALLLGKSAEAQERGVALTVRVLHEVPATRTEPSDLVSVVGNLLDNAIDAASSHRVAGEDPAVDVELSQAQRDGFVLLSVADSGPGVGPDVAETLFDHGVSTKSTGGPMHGIGLHLAQQIAASWGSRVCYVNDAGAIFTVEIPVRTSEPLLGPREEHS